MKSRRSVSAAAVAGAVLLLGAATASAHHSLSSEFDISKTITITGTVTKMEWTNPHSWLHVEVKDEQGQVVLWNIEFGSPNSLYRRGWRRTDLPERAIVAVTGLTIYFEEIPSDYELVGVGLILLGITAVA